MSSTRVLVRSKWGAGLRLLPAPCVSGAHRPTVLPGFGLTLGYTLLYCSA